MNKMAGGRKTKRTAKGKPKAKQTHNVDEEINTKQEKKTSTQSSSAKNDSEQGKHLPQLDENENEPSSTSPLLSKYVPPFSRAGKNSCKSDEKCLTRSPKTRKRRNVASPLVDNKTIVEISNENEAKKDGDNIINNSETSQTITKEQANEDNEGVLIHPNKQIKLSNFDDANHISKSCDMSVNKTHSTKTFDEDETIIEAVASNTTEKDLKGVTVTSIESEKSDECNSQSFKSPKSFSNKVEKSENKTTPTATSASSSEKKEDTSAPTTTPYNSTTISEQYSPLDDVKDCLYHLIEQIELEELKDAETVNVTNIKQSIQEQKHEAGFSSSKQNSPTADSKHVAVKEITNQFSPTKKPKVNETEEQDIQPDEAKPVNEVPVSHDQKDVNKHQPSNVSEMDDIEFLMDCTDSQLIGEEILEQSFADGNSRAEGDTKMDISEKTPTARAVSDHELTDGTFLVQEIMKEISSIKSYLAMMKNKYEQIHKRNGPLTV